MPDKSTPIPRPCLHCGSVFWVFPSRLADGKGLYCSREHRNAAARGKCKIPPEVRFWSKVRRGAADECWIWTANRSNGYGTYHPTKHTTTSAHRHAWILTHGPLDPKFQVCHDCPGGENRACVNPAHMFIGTNLDNVRDMVRKGRHSNGWPAVQNPPRGSRNGQAKLNEADVQRIRRRQAAGEMQSDLAREYGVCDAAITNVVRRKTWRHVPD